MSTKTVAKSTENVKLADIQKGDVFSEISHYRYVGQSTRGHEFNHLESGQPVYLTDVYVSNLLSTADQYNTEVLVGREDKLWTSKQIAEQSFPTNEVPRVGDVRLKGIRSIFEEIYNADVFACMFIKQDKPLSAKKVADLRQAQIDTLVDHIEKARTAKKSVAIAAGTALKILQESPVLPYEPGEPRVLRGYKVQFVSRDGGYDCIDMDIDTSKGASAVRPVNINTLQWLVYKGVKYIVEK